MEYLNIIFNIDVEEKKKTKGYFRDELPELIQKSCIEIPNSHQFETLVYVLKEDVKCIIWLHPALGAKVAFEGTSPSYVNHCRDYLKLLGVDYREITRDLNSTYGPDLIHHIQMPNEQKNIKSYLPFELREFIDKKNRFLAKTVETTVIPDIKILFIGSSPKEMGKINFEDEFEIINSQIADNPHFYICPVFHANISEVQIMYNKIKPFIIHFACHSNESGIFFERDKIDHEIDFLPYDDLKEFFSRRRAVDCVIFNSCRSQNIGNAIKDYIPTVIFMNEETGNISSVKYSEGFYSKLTDYKRREEIDFLKCHDYAKESLNLSGMPEEYTVQIVQKPKLD